MNVSATDKASTKTANITITNNKGRLSKEQIQKLIKQAQKYKDQDEKMRRKVQAKNTLEGYCSNIKHTFNEAGDKVPENEKKEVLDKVSQIENWLSSNSNAEVDEY